MNLVHLHHRATGRMKRVNLAAQLAAAETELACLKMALARVKEDRDTLRHERDDWHRQVEMLSPRSSERLMSGALLPRASPMAASVGGLRRRERPLHAAFRRPSLQLKRPDKMMAGAAGRSAAACWARSALSAPQPAGRVGFDAHGLKAR
jgi:hypothetical protein